MPEIVATQEFIDRALICVAACDGIPAYWLESNNRGQLLSILRRAKVLVHVFDGEKDLREWEMQEMERLQTRLDGSEPSGF